jgi:disulfide bond formation protein DsbB
LGILAAAGSGALLLAALGFQHVAGLAPCALCIWQRWPHVAAVLIGLIGLRVRQAWVFALGALSAATSAGIGIFHTGVELGMWQGLSSCMGDLDVSDMSAKAALDAILTAEVVSCDAVAWDFAGLSMASWNAVLSLLLAGLWVAEICHGRRDERPGARET